MFDVREVFLEFDPLLAHATRARRWIDISAVSTSKYILS